MSNAERRTLSVKEQRVVPRVSDIYAAIPAVTGKLELEYEGELKGSENIARELIESAVLVTFERYFSDQNFDQIVQWFDLGGEVRVDDQIPAGQYYEKVKSIQGLEKFLDEQDIAPATDVEMAVSVVEFILEGLYGQKRLSRSESRGYFSEVEQTEEAYLGSLPHQKSSFN